MHYESVVKDVNGSSKVADAVYDVLICLLESEHCVLLYFMMISFLSVFPTHEVTELFSFFSRCPDDNECDSEPCGQGRGLCLNMDGGYRCICRSGYKHMVQHGRLKCVGKFS